MNTAGITSLILQSLEDEKTKTLAYLEDLNARIDEERKRLTGNGAGQSADAVPFKRKFATGLTLDCLADI